jgi:type IV pilus assembly protein PilW
VNRSPFFHARGGKCSDFFRGFSLIEVLVGLTLSIIAMMVISQIFSISEARKRVTGGAAEAQQVGNITLYQVGRAVRIAGEGFVPATNVWGCALQVTRSATQLLPAAAFPAPFSAVNGIVRVMPVLAYTGAGALPLSGSATGSDVLVVIAGDGQTGQASFDLNAAPLTTGLSLKQSNGFQPLDLLLATEPTAVNPCAVAQVDNTYTYSFTASPRTVTPTLVPIGTSGTTYNAAGLSGFSADARIINIGQQPVFVMLGVNGNGELIQYDLLNLTGTQATTIAENVVDFRVLYGVATGLVGKITWVSPGTSPWRPADLSTGTAAAIPPIDQIRAVRLAMVVRSSESSTEINPPTSYEMFTDLGTLKVSVSIPTAAQKFRYQVYDTTVALRNLRFAPNPRPPS